MSAIHIFRVCLVVWGLSVLLWSEPAATFSPKWGKASDGDAFMKERQATRDGGDEGVCPGGRCREDYDNGGADAPLAHTHAPEEASVPFPPRFSEQLQVSKNEPTGSLSDVDASASSVHIAPDALYRHGTAVGLTVITRRSNGQGVFASGLQISVNVTGAGDTHSGTIFDLHNGTYYLYSIVFYSPALANSRYAEVSVRIDGAHVKGSPMQVRMDFEEIGLDYQRRVDAAALAGARENFDKAEACGGDFVIVTGSSSGMFDRLVNLVGSVHAWAPTTPCIVYDLGMSRPQAEDVQTWHNIEYRKFDFSLYPPHVAAMGENSTYAWRGPILINVTQEHKCALWLDAGLELRGSLDIIKGHIATDGHFHVTNGWPSPNKFTHPHTVQYLGLTKESFYRKDGGLEIESCGGIQGYRRGSVMHRTVLQSYNKCLLDAQCASPEGASKANFRQDQTILNVLLAKYRLGLVHGSTDYFLSLPHTARRYWEHPVPKHRFPERDDGTFRPCEKNQALRGGKCVPCVQREEVEYMDASASVIVCEDDEEVFAELPGAVYVDDLVIFIRRAFQPRLYEESLQYSLVGSI